MTGEFDLIARCFAPLARDPAALGLGDDAALLRPTPGCDLVLTTDSLVAGVHFRDEDPPGEIARKALRVNLSDLAAMGARPRGYLLNVAWPRGLEDRWVEEFARGLEIDQQAFDISVLGGDTVSTPGPFSLTVTAVGEVRQGRALRRDAAEVGDLVYLSGTLGDAALGLQALEGGWTMLSPDECDWLCQRYLLPRPRLALGQGLAEEALSKAALDVSDGLLADLGHICEQSRCTAVVEAALLPLSPAARACLMSERNALETIVAGGDDYELLFTVAPEQAGAVEALGERCGSPVTRIGRIEAMSDDPARQRARLLDTEGREIAVSRRGWQHGG